MPCETWPSTAHLHCDDTDGFADFTGLLAAYPEQAHVYVCGPEAMLHAVLEASEVGGHGTVFFERFAAIKQAPHRPDRAFQVTVASTGAQYEVPAGVTILKVLRTAGLDVDYGCTEGACGSCITDVLEGEIDHRDSILTDDERDAGDCMCICVSRATGLRLVLDL